MKKQLMLLLLLIILVNVGYWALNKKFLHDELIAMVTGAKNEPALILEPEPSPIPQVQSEELQSAEFMADDVDIEVSDSVIETVDFDDPEQLKILIGNLRQEISELQGQTSEISDSIMDLNSDIEVADGKIQQLQQDSE